MGEGAGYGELSEGIWWSGGKKGQGGRENELKRKGKKEDRRDTGVFGLGKKMKWREMGREIEKKEEG